ncbi:hypothetical protein E1B28_008404 [Marasmius oreades]|uniref:Uncharacterized protein n=1 Tax=Marasmius oreades TaxID=181124 RepID=A0A9P7RYG7_9AGAR|nr:uncharacterized protein E1B28_008404 [Marasmius oreades]KAG7092022.1 hypothetical protein E1B28_008404 [Marasmius oreades]
MLPPGAAPPLTPTTPEHHVQFASYPPESSNNVTIASPKKPSSPVEDPRDIIDSTTANVWTPLPLRPIFYIPYIVLLVLLAVGLEIAFHFSQKNTGFKVHGNPNALGKQAGVWHYIYTLPLVALAMCIVGVWAWTDIEIKKLQPYVDLVQGNSPPHKSLLLDYTRTHNFFVWFDALSNRHYTVTIAALLALASLAFQPLSASLLEVRDIWWSLPLSTTTANSVFGLSPGIADPNSPVGDTSVFLSAAGFAAAAVSYDVPNPPFVTIADDGTGWTLMDVKVPPELPRNGTTVAMNTTAINTNVNCRSTSVNMAQQGGPGNWINTIQDSATNCGLTFNVSKTGPTLFGASVAICSNTSTSNLNDPVIFWFFTYVPQPRASATICTPTVKMFEVTATLRLDEGLDGNVIKVVQGKPFDQTKSPFAGSAGNLSALVDSSTGSIKAFNGIVWNSTLTTNDSSIKDRMSAVGVVMPAAIFRSASSGDVGVAGAFTADKFPDLSNKVYTSYLSLVAKSLYFVQPPAGTNVQLQPKTTVKRLFLSAFSTHFLTALLLILAIFSIFIHVTHTYSRRNLHLRHLPGTIASAVSIGGQTSTSALLAKSTAPTESDLEYALRERRFRIDPKTMKIVMEGDEGYDYASSPNRGEFQWVGEALKRGGRRVSGVFTTSGGEYGRRRPASVVSGFGGSAGPRSPRSPRSPMPVSEAEPKMPLMTSRSPEP